MRQADSTNNTPAATSRRTLLGATAALVGGSIVNVTAIVASQANVTARLAVTSDPIFTLIERHRALHNYIEAKEYSRSDEDGVLLATDVAELNAIVAEILSGPFTTVAGLVAALRYINEYEPEELGLNEGSDFLDRVADAIERMAVSA